MPDGVGGWIELFSLIGKFLSFISEKKQTEKEHVEKTLLALNDAYYATKRYFADIENGKEPSRERQFEIALKWDNLSHIIYRYDKNISNRLTIKSRFWMEGTA